MRILILILALACLMLVGGCFEEKQEVDLRGIYLESYWDEDTTWTKTDTLSPVSHHYIGTIKAGESVTLVATIKTPWKERSLIPDPCPPCPELDYEYGYWLYHYSGYGWCQWRYDDWDLTDTIWVAWPSKHCTIDTFLVTNKTVIRQLKNDSLNTTLRGTLSWEREEVLLRDFRPCPDTVMPPGTWMTSKFFCYWCGMDKELETWPDSVFILSEKE